RRPRLRRPGHERAPRPSRGALGEGRRRAARAPRGRAPEPGAGRDRLVGHCCARHGRHRGTQARIADVPRRARAAKSPAVAAWRPPRSARPRHACPARTVTSWRTLACASFLGPRQTGSRAIGLVKPWTPCYLRLDHRVRLRPTTPGGAMAARTATARSPQKVQRELEDLQLVLKARNGDSVAMDAL